MADKSKRSCWDYLDIGARSEVPVIQVWIVIGNKSEKYTFIIDTGYDGYLLVPYAIYKHLELEKYEIPKNLWSVGETISGEIIPLITATCKIKVMDLTFECPIETFEGSDEFLAGLSFLNKFITILDGKNKKCCIEKV
ncbi:MAG: hypothetical protein ACTSSP_06995 [Candidatus Asgardarchaeia archaeon]|nr:hypothetical protein [Candidatus Odinarchaeota archaeon]